MSNFAQHFPDKKERTDFWIAITVILLFLAAIIYYLFGPQKIGEVSGLSTTSDQIENPTDFDYTTPVDTLNQTYDSNTGDEEELTALVAAVEKDSVISDSQAALPIEAEEVITKEPETPIVKEEIKEEVKEELPVYVDEEDNLNSEKVIDEELPVEDTAIAEEVEAAEKEEEPVVEIEAPIAVEKEEVESNNRFELEKDEQASNYGCIVIIGSFKEPDNAKQLANKLEKQNLPVYEGIYKGYYIVGVNSSCEKSKVVPLLNKMKKQYEKGAWIYKR